MGEVRPDPTRSTPARQIKMPTGRGEQAEAAGEVNVVEIVMMLDEPVKEELYDYIVNK